VVLLLVGWVIWINKSLPLRCVRIPSVRITLPLRCVRIKSCAQSYCFSCKRKLHAHCCYDFLHQCISSYVVLDRRANVDGHTQVAIPHLYRQERKRPTPVRRRLSRTQALLGRVIPGGCVPVSGIEVRSFVGLYAYCTFHWWSPHCAARMLLSEKLMSCCAAGTNGCLDLRHCAAGPDGRVSAEWSRCPGSMTRRPRDSVALLRRSSAGWMPARIGRLSTDVGRRHPVTIRMSTAAPNRSAVFCSRMDQG